MYRHLQRFVRWFAVAALLIVAAAPPSLSDPLGTSFTYQGQIDQGGGPLNGSADFQFALYDALASGAPVGSILTINNVTVTDGIFAALLDFGVDVFNGDARFLEIAVRSPSGGGLFTTLSPRVTVTATPYALQTRGIFVNDEGEVSIGTGETSFVAERALAGVQFHTFGDLTATTAMLGETSTTAGVSVGVKGRSRSDQGIGLVGESLSGGGSTQGVLGTSVSPLGEGVRGLGATGVCGVSGAEGGMGVVGEANGAGATIGVQGTSDSNEGVRGEGPTAGVCGVSDGDDGTGVVGLATGKGATIGVEGTSATHEGVHGEGLTAGVCGVSDGDNAKGVVGLATGAGTTIGVEGTSATHEGVHGEGPTAGVCGVSAGDGGTGVVGLATGTGATIGVSGTSDTNEGVHGEGPIAGVCGVGVGTGGAGVIGVSPGGTGVNGVGLTGVRGSSPSPDGSGVLGEALGTGDGVRGTSVSGDGVSGAGKSGVSGVSTDTKNPSAAGIVAVGGGSNPTGPNAAALEIRDGAIRVSGSSDRPVGSFAPTPLNWTTLYSCNGGGAHYHVIGWFAQTILPNELLVDDSILLLTLEEPDQAALDLSLSVSIVATHQGSAEIRISAIGIDIPPTCIAPPASIAPIVHYLIINPES